MKVLRALLVFAITFCCCNLSSTIYCSNQTAPCRLVDHCILRFRMRACVLLLCGFVSTHARMRNRNAHVWKTVSQLMCGRFTVRRCGCFYFFLMFLNDKITTPSFTALFVACHLKCGVKHFYPLLRVRERFTPWSHSSILLLLNQRVFYLIGLGTTCLPA